MKNTALIFALLFYTSFVSYTQEVKRKPLEIGEIIEFESSILNETRTLNIYLPVSYSENPNKKYPVIYLLDGTITEDFLHIVGIVQFGSYPWINMVPESIVVGISNIDRKRDFTSTTEIEEHKKAFPTTGFSKKFIACLANEIQPIIENNYHVSRQRTIIGQSLGGLLATEILLNQPELFDNYIIISPSLWWNNESLLQITPKKCDSPKTIFIGVGKEGKIMESEAKKLFKKLSRDQMNYSDVYFEYFKKQDHANILHLAVYNAFLKMFKVVEEEKGD